MFVLNIKKFFKNVFFQFPVFLFEKEYLTLSQNRNKVVIVRCLELCACTIKLLHATDARVTGVSSLACYPARHPAYHPTHSAAHHPAHRPARHPPIIRQEVQNIIQNVVRHIVWHVVRHVVQHIVWHIIQHIIWH